MSDSNGYYEIRNAIRKTLDRKINRGGRTKKLKNEVKATETTVEAKRYFYKQVAKLRFGIYSITLNKRRVFEQLTREKERIYNFVARLVLDQIPFERASDSVQIIVDKSKGRMEINEFNSYVVRQLKGRLNPKMPLYINHITSEQDPALQAADLFAWGIFRSYERDDKTWLSVFQEKVRYNKLYLP